MFSKEKLGLKVAELRRESGINQAQLADIINVGQSAIAMVESGKRAVSVEALCALSDYFQVPSDFLLGRGVFENWEEYQDHRDDLYRIMEKRLGFAEGTFAGASTAQLAQLIYSAFGRIEYDPISNNLDLYPLFPRV